MNAWETELAWKQGNVSEAWTVPGLCTVSTRHVPCPNAEAGVLTVGCVHEHLHLARPCLGCLGRVRASVTARACWCHLCAKSSLPHDCLVYELSWKPHDGS